MREREIMGLKVTNILTADTFEVFPPWRWENQSGIKVRVAGIEVLFEGEPGYEKEVDYDKLVCDVYVDGKSVAKSIDNRNSSNTSSQNILNKE